ncbi:MAG: hypothetical protein KBD78_08735 [Oligoflexales bacterium]|nr:hypothetical protein [Oligoflexales bacterium]
MIKVLLCLIVLQGCNNSGQSVRQIKIGETLQLFPSAFENSKQSENILITFLNNDKKIDFNLERDFEIVFHANSFKEADLIKSFDDLKNAKVVTQCSEEILSYLLEAGPESILFCNSALDLEKYSSFSLRKIGSKNFSSRATNFMTKYNLPYESLKAIIINFQ